MELNITDILQAVLILATVILTSYVIPILKHKLSSSEFDELLFWTNLGVKAVDRLVNLSGEDKKLKVKEYLSRKGLVYDEEEIDNTIEACVTDLHKVTEKS